MFWLLFALDVGFFFDSRTLFAFLLFVHYCSLLFLEKITIKFFSFLVFTGKIILVGRMKKLQKMLKRIKSTSLASKKIIFFFFEENYTKKCFFLFQYWIISLNLATRFLFTFQICETIEEDETHAPETPPSINLHLAPPTPRRKLPPLSPMTKITATWLSRTTSTGPTPTYPLKPQATPSIKTTWPLQRFYYGLTWLVTNRTKRSAPFASSLFRCWRKLDGTALLICIVLFSIASIFS